MTDEQPPQVSVISPLSPAFARVKLLLFKPFDFGKWMLIGFCAWLAMLDKGGFNFNVPLQWKKDYPSADPQLEHIKEFARDNLPLIIPVACIVVVAVISIWVVLLWLSSRGHFMFLDCVARDKAGVKEPWRRFHARANSLFVFRLVLHLVGPVVLLLVIALPLASLYALSRCIEVRAIPVAAFVAGALVFGIFIIALVLVAKFTIDFAVPIMYCTTKSCLSAWRHLWILVAANPGQFILYVLFQVVIHVAVGCLLTALTCVTCCVAGCIMLIPYIGTVFILPVLVFTRSYSLYYIRQYGPEFDVFGPVAVQPTQ
jgi:hypothetical protein